MNENNDINLPEDFDDLSKHAPLLDQLRAGKDFGFVVPENYFNDAVDLSENKSKLSDVANENSGFIFPENYFEELTERINNVVELNELTPDSYRDGFSLPENYFENLADEITALANLADFKYADGFEIPDEYFAELDNELNTTIALDNLKQDEGFIVPHNYFQNFSNSVFSRLAMEGLLPENEEAAPEGYFDTLADRITDRIAAMESVANDDTKNKKAKNRARIIVFAEVIKRYAKPVSLAASVALIIGVSIWFFNRSNGISPVHEVAIHEKAKQGPDNIIPKSNYVPPQVIASVNNEKPKHKNNGGGVNHPADHFVKVEMKDVIAQVDLLDENTIADVITDDALKNNSDNSVDESILEQLNDSDINNK